MLNIQSDQKIEIQITALFNSVQFSKSQNKKIFNKWKDSACKPANFSGVIQNQPHTTGIVIPTDFGYAGSAARQADFVNSRKQLLKELIEIDQSLRSHGESAAEKLLFKYTQTISPIVMYIAILLLLITLYFFWWALTAESRSDSPPSINPFEQNK